MAASDTRRVSPPPPIGARCHPCVNGGCRRSWEAHSKKSALWHERRRQVPFSALCAELWRLSHSRHRPARPELRGPHHRRRGRSPARRGVVGSRAPPRPGVVHRRWGGGGIPARHGHDGRAGLTYGCHRQGPSQLRRGGRWHHTPRRSPSSCASASVSLSSSSRAPPLAGDGWLPEFAAPIPCAASTSPRMATSISRAVCSL